MATVRTDSTSDFKTIYINSDSNTMNTDYPVLEVYVDNVLTYTLVVSGSATIGSTTYTTTTGATNLNFTSVTTTNGTEYQFAVTPAILGLTDTYFPDGVYTFKLLDTTETTDIFNYEVQYYLKNCCMAKKLNDAYATSMSDIISKAEDEVITVKTFIESAIASAQIDDVTNAVTKFAVAELICNNCGCS